MSDRSRLLNCALIKPAGPDCNMACRYCFYLPKHELFPETSTHRMSDEVLEALVRQVMQGGGSNVVFAWQGGEPTLMGVEFFLRAVAFQREYGRPGQTVGNGLQTNGLLIDERWCDLLRDSQFLVGLSLDGPQHVHDHHRVLAGGQPSWERVVAAARRMLAADVEVNALVVVNDRSARHAREIYEFHRELGLVHMQFIPCLECNPAEPGAVMPFSVSADAFGEFLCTVFDSWQADFRDGAPTTFVRWFDSVFATYVNLRPPECTLLDKCGDYVVVEHNGDVFSCDFYVEPDWRLGNVLEDSLMEMLNSPQQQRFGRRKAELADDCRGCRWLPHCQGGCPKERLGEGDVPRPSHLCAGYQMFFEHADARLRELAAVWIKAQRQDNAMIASAARRSRCDARVGRNDPCPCGSGQKYKRCCGQATQRI